MLLAKFPCSKWPNIEKIIKPSGHTEALGIIIKHREPLTTIRVIHVPVKTKAPNLNGPNEKICYLIKRLNPNQAILKHFDWMFEFSTHHSAQK